MLVYAGPSRSGRRKIAALDFLRTIVHFGRDLELPANAQDFQFTRGDIPAKLRHLCHSGYKVVVLARMVRGACACRCRQETAPTHQRSACSAPSIATASS